MMKKLVLLTKASSDKNLELAIAAYISRVDCCPCGDSSIRCLEDVILKKIKSRMRNFPSFLRALSELKSS